MQLRNHTSNEVNSSESKPSGALTPLFHTEAKCVWPFDAQCTQLIFSLAGTANLRSISSTGRFFHRNAVELATRTLLNVYKIDCRSTPDCFPVPLLARVESYYNGLQNPIKTLNYKSGFRSIVDPTHIVSASSALLSICVKKNNDLCILASFGRKADVSSKTSDTEICQFVAGVDSKGHVFVKRITETELETLIAGVLQDSERNMALKACVPNEFNPCADYLLSVLREQKKTNFMELIENLPWGDTEMKKFILGLVAAHLGIKNSSCQIL